MEKNSLAKALDANVALAAKEIVANLDSWMQEATVASRSQTEVSEVDFYRSFMEARIDTEVRFAVAISFLT